MSRNEPGVYVKDGTEKIAHSRRDAVALTFDGYKRKDNDEVESDQPMNAEPIVSGPPAETSVNDDPGNAAFNVTGLTRDF